MKRHRLDSEQSPICEIGIQISVHSRVCDDSEEHERLPNVTKNIRRISKGDFFSGPNNKLGGGAHRTTDKYQAHILLAMCIPDMLEDEQGRRRAWIV